MWSASRRRLGSQGDPGPPDDGSSLDRLLHGRRALGRVPEIVDWYVEKKIDLDSLVTHRLRLEQIGEGFEMMKRGESIRSVIVL